MSLTYKRCLLNDNIIKSKLNHIDIVQVRVLDSWGNLKSLDYIKFISNVFSIFTLSVFWLFTSLNVDTWKTQDSYNLLY